MKTLDAPIRCATEETVTGPPPSLPAAESHHNAVTYIAREPNLMPEYCRERPIWGG
jgi:hypothetical protein